ncbi:MAG TPA: putative manganese transporter [Afifellaceae bacterium]|nr:putative manganese transporter [Afifellaceae bacterium]
MVELVARSGRGLAAFSSARLLAGRRRLVPVALLALLLVSSEEIATLVRQAMADAYLQVTVYVAATLAVFYSAERLLNVDLGAAMARRLAWQPVIAACLGALPGCGGAIIVVTQFTRGQASFGALISVLIATMGDAAFLLIARDPDTALLVISISMLAGALSGWVVDRLHRPGFMRPERTERRSAVTSPPVLDRLPAWMVGMWFALLAPGLAVGILVALQLDVDAIVGVAGFSHWFGFAGAAVTLALWVLSGSSDHGHIAASGPAVSTRLRILSDTSFVAAWVTAAFLGYELVVFALGADVSVLFRSWLPLMPLVATLVGFVPGCGPQIVVTTLYLTGAVPFSALIANAISTDGDALFPAIALAPRAAIAATLYSALPALAIGYGWLLLLE